MVSSRSSKARHTPDRRESFRLAIPTDANFSNPPWPSARWPDWAPSQHDTATPRPCSRHNLIQGTNGVFAGFPNRIALETDGGETFHEWDYDMENWYARYDRPLWVQMGRRAEQQGGHGGMDHLLCWRIVDCLRNGEPLDQSVYDAAAWSVIGPISAESVADRGNSMAIPGFTRGAWRTTEPLPVVGGSA